MAEANARGLQLPLNVLLTVAFWDLTSEIPAAVNRRMQVSMLEAHANLLSHLDEPVPVRDLPVRTRVTKRSIRYLADRAQRGGMVETARHVIRRTGQGNDLVRDVRESIDAGTAAWAARHGLDMATLRSAVGGFVSQLDLELAHHPVGYGPADSSATGGIRWGRGAHARRPGGPIYDAERERGRATAWDEAEGRLQVHSSGQDWRSVPRESATVDALPITALLSQALMAFTIDFESLGGMPLALAGNVVRTLPDEMEIRIRPSRGQRTNPIPQDPVLAALERHEYARIDPLPNGRTARFRLTDKGCAVQLAYADNAAFVEARWRHRYGTDTVERLRRELAPLAAATPDPAHHVLLA